MLTRTVVLMAVIGMTASAAPKHRDWHTGTLDPVLLVYVDRNGGRLLNDGDGTPAFDTATVPLVIRAGSLVYRAEERAATTVHVEAVDAAGIVSLQRSADAASVLPWVAALPPAVQFAVEGKVLYYLDGKGKEHKTKLIGAVHASQ